MSDQARTKHAEAVIDAYQRQVDRGVNPREAHHRIVMDVATKASASTRQEAQQIADRAIKTYAAKSIDMSPGDAKASAVREVTRSQETGLDVKTFTRNVMNSTQNTSNPNGVALSHAAAAANEARVSIHSAARIAQTVMREYGALRQKGADHIAAREKVAETMAQRYDDRGRDTQRQARQHSQGQSR